jgi:hypothetical protein
MIYLKKFCLISLYLLIHFLILTEVRTALFQYQISGVKFYYSSHDSEITINRIDTRIIDFNYPVSNKTTEKVWSYKIPYGFFFLLGIIGLIIVGSDRKFYIVLLLSHFVVLLMGSLVFYLSINVNTWLLAISDLLTRYFTPMVSISVVAFALLEKRK